MPNYKLYYFNTMGRGETARMMFALTGTEFEDIRVLPEEWPAMKPNMPMGVLPVLSVDGKLLGQSTAINSYLARELGLYGKDSMQTARIDEIVNCLSDIAQDLYKVVFGKTEEEKAAQKKQFEEKVFPVWMEKFDKILDYYYENYGDGDQITLAEISAFNAVFVIRKMTSIDKLSSNLEAFVKKVETNENVKKWLAKRPVTNI